MSLSSLLLAGRYKSMTSYFSLAFLVGFLPISIVTYFFVPQKAKKYVLLVFSMAFFWLISGKLIAYLLLTVISVHWFGLWLERLKNESSAAAKTIPKEEKEERKKIKSKYRTKMRAVLCFAVLLHIGALVMLKYSPFFVTNINSLLSLVHIPLTLDIPKYMIPVGLSFFSLQALSYIIDVYRGTVKADGNIFRLALFISFFPQIVEGPICRYSQTADALWNVKQIKYDDLAIGLQRFLYGFMKKLVIADRLNAAVKEIFDNYESFDGGIIFLGAVFYTVQLYADFSGSMDAVVGIGRIFGVKMPENFRQPFFSRTISEFWQRWHITLGTWFKDYIFYPVTMSKPMKKLTTTARKKLGNHFGPLLAGAAALFCVWLANGLWHGAAWSYIFFGMYHFALILGGSIISPAIKFINGKLHISPENPVYKAMQIIRSCLLVVIGEMFFRANGLKAGLAMFTRLITHAGFTPLTKDVLTALHIDMRDIIIVCVAAAIILAVGIFREKGIDVGEKLYSKNIVVRRAVLYSLIMFIVIFGAYGAGYVPVDPMYAEF